MAFEGRHCSFSLFLHSVLPAQRIVAHNDSRSAYTGTALFVTSGPFCAPRHTVSELELLDKGIIVSGLTTYLYGTTGARWGCMRSRTFVTDESSATKLQISCCHLLQGLLAAIP